MVQCVHRRHMRRCFSTLYDRSAKRICYSETRQGRHLYLPYGPDLLLSPKRRRSPNLRNQSLRDDLGWYTKKAQFEYPGSKLNYCQPLWTKMMMMLNCQPQGQRYRLNPSPNHYQKYQTWCTRMVAKARYHGCRYLLSPRLAVRSARRN